MREIKAENFDEEVQNSKEDVILSFTADWCGFCKGTEKMLTVAESELADVKFYLADIEQNSELAKKYNVRGVPTTLFFKDGEMKNRKTGALTKAEVYSLAGREIIKTAEI